ncbi:GNAT family N-acetyltransferase [Billgrantia endophytica]|uniref:N-acetyltransferase n=1 Tax=Billgrantia endophytica TaxID=2033802 RepID=A0A2N7TYS6_9GAMM|nr:GNAT family N-acetyltransferase [Halomonas endophytica]PMR73342.1 N-acetyltransferase [Halomonas endophytica]
MSIRLLPLEARHLDQAVGLSTAAGWPHRGRDWQLLTSLGEGLALVENERLVATAMHWSFDPGLATLGMVVVSPMYQRRGLGRRLMEAALAGIDASRVELHATAEGTGLYRSLGFVDIACVCQCQGYVVTGAPVEERYVVRAARACDVGALVALDAQAVGSPRHHLLYALLEHGEALVVEEDGSLAGFSICREFGHGHVIGPVVATTLPVAKRLVESWLERLKGGFVRVDTPDPELAGWLGERGLREVDRVRRMTLGGESGAEGSAIRFALASQALG